MIVTDFQRIHRRDVCWLCVNEGRLVQVGHDDEMVLFLE